MMVDYSIVRGTMRATGTMHIVTDGADASLATSGTSLTGDIGVTFTASISSADLVISYTSDSSGTGTMKYMVRRWSSGSGGAAGVPTYSGAAAAPTTAGGPVNSVQFNSGGAVTGNANFAIDTVDLSVNLNELRQGVLSSSIILTDASTSWTNLFSMSDSYPCVILDYSVAKEGFVRVGQLLVACDGTNVSSNETFTE